MPRAVKPETAAKKIIELIASGGATNADDAIAKHPHLANGKDLLTAATSGTTSSSPAAPAAPRARATGSGPALLSR